MAVSKGAVISNWFLPTELGPTENTERQISNIVEKDGKNPIVTKGREMTYAQAVKCKKTVEDQNSKILNNEPIVTQPLIKKKQSRFVI